MYSHSFHHSKIMLFFMIFMVTACTQDMFSPLENIISNLNISPFSIEKQYRLIIVPYARVYQKPHIDAPISQILKIGELTYLYDHYFNQNHEHWLKIGTVTETGKAGSHIYGWVLSHTTKAYQLHQLAFSHGTNLKQQLLNNENTPYLDNEIHYILPKNSPKKSS